MKIECPSCKASIKVSGLLEFNCTSCGKKFSKPVPLKAKDAGIFILCGVLAALCGLIFFGVIKQGILNQLAPFIIILGAVSFFKGVLQKLFADKSVLVVDEIEDSHVVKVHKVVVLDEIEALKHITEQESDNAGAYYNLGFANAKSGRYQEAIEVLKQAITLKPDYAEAHGILGIVYVELGRYQEAIDAYRQAIVLNPDRAVTYYNLGVAHFKSDHYQEAIEAYKQAIKLEANAAEVHANLGNAYLKLGNKEGALEEYRILKTLDPEWADKLYSMINQ
jgi:lipoprotein NlpI